MSNYRPVPIIIQLGKLTEMEVSDQTIKHFTDNNLIHPAHNGNLPGLSTDTAILSVYDKMIKGAEDKNLTGTVLLDQSSAMVHSISVKKIL